MNRHILRTIYFAIFDTHLNYGNLTWDQNLNAVSFVVLQKKDLRSMNIHSRDSHSSPLFKSNHILKLEDKMNILFINKALNNFFLQFLKIGSPSALMFTIIKQSHLPLIKYLNHHIEQIISKNIRSL